jgi:sugar-phosphatase
MKAASIHRDPSYGRGFAAFLFDMDGTLLNSIAVANRVWADWARRHGLDVGEVLAAMHGVQVLDTVARFAPAGVDRDIEAATITSAELRDVDGIVEISGAARFLAHLPADRWAVVTSAPRELALRRITAAGLPIPALLIGAEDVAVGKPAPDCFLAAAAALGVTPGDCLVWEDSPAGVVAAERAGMEVVVVIGAHQESLKSDHPHIRDYSAIALLIEPGGELRISLESAVAASGS